MKEAALKRSLREALVESVRENRDVFRDLMAEVIEDVSMANAIREGERTRPVKRETVMRALRGRK